MFTQMENIMLDTITNEMNYLPDNSNEETYGKNKKILVVDDDVDILLMLTIFLKEKGYEVEGTLNGIEASSRTERFKPDLIIMDIFLSGTNGKDICLSLKTAEKTKKIPIILISSDEQNQQELENAGANEFINKPFEIKYLLTRVRELLNTSAAA